MQLELSNKEKKLERKFSFFKREVKESKAVSAGYCTLIALFILAPICLKLNNVTGSSLVMVMSYMMSILLGAKAFLNIQKPEIKISQLLTFYSFSVFLAAVPSIVINHAEPVITPYSVNADISFDEVGPKKGLELITPRPTIY